MYVCIFTLRDLFQYLPENIFFLHLMDSKIKMQIYYIFLYTFKHDVTLIKMFIVYF